jgi:hypothetical protein
MSKSRFQRFSLRNVPLHIDQMETVGLDAKAYAETMAEALALMHWDARFDANDVESYWRLRERSIRNHSLSSPTTWALTASGSWISIAVSRWRWTKQALSKPARRFSRMILSILDQELGKRLTRTSGGCSSKSS